MSIVFEGAELWGINARDHGAEAAAQASSEWTRKAEAWVAALLPGSTFTIDDVRFSLGPPESDNAAGAVCRNLHAAGVVAFVDYRVSTRIKRHSGRVAVWRKV